MCASLDGMQIGMDESFAYKGRLLFTGQKLMPPAHPRCGCGVQQYIKVEEPLALGGTHDIIKLPEYQNAVIPETKFTDYALNPEKDKNKALAFEKALGYNKDNVDDLIGQIRYNLPFYNSVEKGDKGYGMTYEVVMDITGPNGKQAKVLTGWIKDSENGEVRLITAHVDKEK